MTLKCDVVVIGGGPGGYVCAIRLSQLGLRVFCVEKNKTLGGTCLNVGCIPSKALLHASESYYKAEEKFSALGINISKPTIDINKIMSYKDKVVDGLTKGVQYLLKKNKIEFIEATGTILSNHEVEIEKKGREKDKIVCKKIVIATGSCTSEIPGFNIDEKYILSSTGALSIAKVPSHLVVVGGGYIGLEMSSVWSRFGSKVTIVEFASDILPVMDKEISTNFQKILKKNSIDLFLSTKAVSAVKEKDELIVNIESVKNGDKKNIICEKILVATGRKPYVDGLGIEGIGVKLDKNGFIQTSNFQTNIENIFAIGDVRGGLMLAHKAEDEGVALAEIIAGQSGHVNYEVIPSVVYTSPEIASVGKTEEELKNQGISYNVGKFPFNANPRAKINLETDGFVKILTEKSTDKILGVHMISIHAGELISEIVTAMEFGASSEDIARTCHAHPTLSEAIKESSLDIAKRAIHS